MPRILSFINYKGGVGKTTTTYHVGAWLALHHGKRVLLVDVDPQANLTFLCATPERWETFREQTGTIADLYRAHLNGEDFPLPNIVWKQPIERSGRPVVPNLDLVPSDVELLSIDLDLQASSTGFTRLEDAAAQHLEKRSILKNAIDAIRDEYDYILIDCPPNLYLVTQNALAVSDSYIVTALPDHLSTIGLKILHDRIGHLNRLLTYASAISGDTMNGPTLGGIVFVRVRQGGERVTNAHARKMAEIRMMSDYKSAVFDAYTVEGTGYGEASELALPVFLIDTPNTNRVAGHYRQIGDELLKRFP